MDSRTDFQRLLEDMDKAIQAKSLELSELDERLKSSRSELSEREALELRREIEASDLDQSAGLGGGKERENLERQEKLAEQVAEQKRLYQHQLDQFNEELTELETINKNLLKENSSLRQELDASQALAKELSDKCQSLAESLHEVKEANLELNLRLATAESESQMQQRLLKKTHNEDEVLMGAFNDKLESLRKAIEWRDEEIKRLRLENEFTLESLGSINLTAPESAQNNGGLAQSNQSGGRLRVAEIGRALREKDSYIELLKSQLIQASSDLERHASYIESLSKQQQSSKQTIGAFMADTSDESHELRLKMLENELEAKDKQLNLVEFRNHHYEIVLPTMISDLIQELARALRRKVNKMANNERENEGKLSPDSMTIINELSKNLNWLHGEMGSAQVLLDKIDHLNGLNAEKSDKIEHLVNELNQLDAKYNLVQHQCDLLRSQTAGSETNDRSAAKHSRASRLDEKRSKQVAFAGSSELEGDKVKVKVKGDLCGEGGHESGAFGRQQDEPGQVVAECQEEHVDYRPPGGAISASPAHSQHQSIKASLECESSTNATFTSGLRAQGESSSSGRPESVSADVSAEVAGTAAAARANNSRPLSGQHSRANESESKRSINNSAAPPVEPLPPLPPPPGEQSVDRCQSEERTTTREATQPAIDVVAHLRAQLGHLESENELLELAMKEILLSIKWSDAQCSTILIDCPSLERLCQLIEARFLTQSVHESSGQQRANAATTCCCSSLLNCGEWPHAQCCHRSTGEPVADAPSGGQAIAAPPDERERPQTSGRCPTCANLFQIVVLKSELDLLRGQNEQLRADIKLHRQEQSLVLSSGEYGQQVGSNHQRAEAECQTEPAVTFYAFSRANVKDYSGNNNNNSMAQESTGENCALLHTVDNDNDEGNNAAISPLIGSGEMKMKTAAFEQENKETERKWQKKGKCENCGRLSNLTNHLMQCILRIETRFLASEETFMRRLISLRGSYAQLIQLLDKDISMRDSLLNESRREYCALKEQKGQVECRLDLLEGQMSAHLRVCPLITHLNSSSTSAANFVATQNGGAAGGNLSVYTSAKNGFGQSIESLTIKQVEQERRATRGMEPRAARGAQIAIALLQSIIGCLQARIDYKDERLRQLEAMLQSRATRPDGSDQGEGETNGRVSGRPVSVGLGVARSHKLIKVR